jgi:S-adenosylmethionine hydrolase
LHVVVVDPGVGSARAILYVETAGQRLLVPDNGCWTWIGGQGTPPKRLIRVSNSRYWRQTVSATFHGRDIFAPVAGHLSRGLDPAQLGPAVNAWISLKMPEPRRSATGWDGEVLFVDRFGNLITNIVGDPKWPTPTILTVGKRVLRRGFRWVRTYAEAAPGQLVGLISSDGYLEIAIAQGNAAQHLRAQVGTPVSIRWEQ